MHTHTSTHPHTSHPPCPSSKGERVHQTVASIPSTWTTLKGMNLIRVLQQGFPTQGPTTERCGWVGQWVGRWVMTSDSVHPNTFGCIHSTHWHTQVSPLHSPCCRLRNVIENMIKQLVSLFEMVFLMSKVNLDLELELEPGRLIWCLLTLLCCKIFNVYPT